jgi:acyl-CoA thioesterase
VGDLAVDTAVEGGEGRYTARLSSDWEIWGPMGGYVASIALRAAGAHSGLTRPAAMSVHFLSVASFDAVDIEVATLRSSRRAASVRVDVSQGGKAVLEALVWMVAGAGDGLVHDHAVAPAVTHHSELKTIRELVDPETRPPFRFWENFDAKPLKWVEDWENRPPGEPVWQQWLRFLPTPTFADPYVDACRLLILADVASWPSAAQAHRANSGFIAPNLDVNVQFHRPASEHEWLLADGFSGVAEDGLIGFRSQVWSDGGALLASGSGQLLCRRIPG